MLLQQNLNPDLIFGLILLLPVIGLMISFSIDQPGYYERVGMMLGVLINIPYLILINILAIHAGWWSYFSATNSFYGVPIELLIGWSVFWGALLPYVFRKLPIAIALAVALIIDLWIMPVLNNIFLLGKGWLYGETLSILFCLLPAIIIFRLTTNRRRVAVRAFIQSVIWGGWVIFLIPAVLLQYENKDIFNILNFKILSIMLFISAMTISMSIGYAGLWEFASKGKGTPIPFDPPQKLVKTGIYAYVANPLQISTLLMFITIMLTYNSLLMLLPIITHIIYCEGFVRWHHTVDLEKRFGKDWLEYKTQVKDWFPRINYPV